MQKEVDEQKKQIVQLQQNDNKDINKAYQKVLSKILGGMKIYGANYNNQTELNIQAQYEHGICQNWTTKGNSQECEATISSTKIQSLL